MRMAALIAVVLICLGARAANDPPASVSTAIDVQPSDLLVEPPAANWTSYNGDYSGRRYSSLTEITPDNLAKAPR